MKKCWNPGLQVLNIVVFGDFYKWHMALGHNVLLTGFVKLTMVQYQYGNKNILPLWKHAYSNI